MQDKVRSALVLPQRRQAFSQRKEELEQYHRQVFSREASRSSKRLTSTAHQTNIFKKHIINRREAFTPFRLERQIQPSYARPFTQAGRRNHERVDSPLSVIRTRSKCQSARENIKQQQAKPLLKTDFLKKGSSIDRGVICNVLKSKLNLNICAPSFSYVDCAENAELAKIVSSQIPKGIKDVVGVEEMLRMSHIMTGAKFKSVSLTRRLNTMLKQRKKQYYQLTHHQDDDNLTLKSIKRW